MKLPDFKDRDGNWVRTVRIKGKQYYTRGGKLWADIKYRCTGESSAQRKRPKYKGCTLDFANFNSFVEWCHTQKGYFEGFEIDKDILYKGNKSYSDKTCVFVPKALNNFIIKCDTK